jgi:rhodanese-related sulfurtransferase
MKTITVKELIEILPNLDDKCVIVDVRETEEFKEKRIENSINMPLSSIGKSLPKRTKQDDSDLCAVESPSGLTRRYCGLLREPTLSIDWGFRVRA